jgi:zinc and cadmium transporter
VNGWVLIAAAAPVLFAASLLGAGVQGLLAGSHLRVQTMLSFVGGLMLGMGLLHLLPHAVIQTGQLDRSMWAMLLGVLVIFLLMRFGHVHSHEPGVACLDTQADDGHQHAHDHHHDHSGHHHGRREQGPAPHAEHRTRWMTLLLGLALHGVVDGVAVASAVRIGVGHDPVPVVPGLGVLVVVLLHKPIDAVALSATMASAGASAPRRRMIGLLFALVTPAAAVLAYAGLIEQPAWAGYALAFSAGAFLCVALADLMPELQFHSHHRGRLTAGLLAGIGLALLLGAFEGHNHGHGPERAEHHQHAH